MRTSVIYFAAVVTFFFFLLLIFSSPILSGRRLDVYHIPHMMWRQCEFRMSEQFLNGTSAHYRPFSATNGEFRM